MPPKASTAPWRRPVRSSARKSTIQVTKSTEHPPPSTPADATTPPPPEENNELSLSTNSKISGEKSLIEASNIEEPVVKLSSPEDTVEIEQKAGKKKVVKKTVRIVKKIVKKKVPKSIGEPEAVNLEPCTAVEGKKGNFHPMEVEKATVDKADPIEQETVNLEPCTALEGDFHPMEVEKGTIVAEGNNGIKDSEVKNPILECKGTNEDNTGSIETPNVVLDSEKGNFYPIQGTSVAEVTDDCEVKNPVLECKDTNDNVETPNLVLESKKGNLDPIEVEEGTITAKGVVGNDGMKECEVKDEPPMLESKDSNDNNIETPNAVLDSEKGKRRSVKIVKKIVKKKVPKLAARDSGKNNELVKLSKNGDAEIILDSVGGEKSNFRTTKTENLEPCKVVSVEGEESKKHGLHTMEVEKATSVSRLSVTASILEPPVLDCKDTTVVKNDKMVSLESQTVVLDSEKSNLDVSTSDNVDSSKDQIPGQLGEEGYSQSREETKEAVDTSLRLNEGILLSGEMEALERKKRRRTEIFIGGLDKETKEGDIRRIFEEVGEVVDVTLLMNRATGKNKGFAFLRYVSAADAKKAVERYSKVEISGKECGVSLVDGNDTIYLGNIDKKWKTEDVIDLLKKGGIENIDKVTVMADPNNIEQNRGFAFVELETSKEAQIAFNKLQKKDVFGKRSKVKVAWAQPLIEPNEEEMLKVKSVYAEYVPSSWNEEKVREYFGKFGDIESIVLAKDLPSSRRKDFSFVNYKSRESALACIEAFSHEPVNNSGSKVNMKVSLAKPMPKGKQTKRATVPSKKEHREEKKIQDQSISKRYEPSKQVNYMRRCDESHRVDRGSSTNDELLHLLRIQRSAGQVHPGLNIGSGVDHQYSLSGSKRPYSAVVDNPHRMDYGGLSRLRLESSFPTSSQSMLSHSRGPLGTPSFPYYRQLGSGRSQGSVYGVESFPSSFQSQERGPYGGYSSIYRRY